MRDAFLRGLTHLARHNDKIMLLTADLGYGVFDEYSRCFPDQYLNVGVAEQNMIGIATGLALEGHIVFAYSIANFSSLRCLEQIRNDASYHEANVNIVASGGGFSYGALGMSHHATEDLAILRALPGLTVVAPCCPWEAENATLALAMTQGVGYLRLDKTSVDGIDNSGLSFVLGKARRLREGSDLSIFCTGGIASEGLRLADLLETRGMHCRVVSMHTIKPLDRQEILDAVDETRRVITIEEHNLSGGLGSAIAEVCMDAGIHPLMFHRFGLDDRYSSIVGSQEFLREQYGLDAGTMMRDVSVLMGFP